MSQELSLSSSESAQVLPVGSETVAEAPSWAQAHDADELARTAGLLIDTVKNESNPKFKNSAFMGLMRQLRDGEVTVEGNDMVQRSESFGGVQSSVDSKGKGRAVSPAGNVLQRPATATPTLVPLEQQTSDEVGATRQEDPNDAYFRRENEEYIAMQAASSQLHNVPSTLFAPQQAEWANLQRDWDAFEATASGLRPLSNYQFIENNPYLRGEASRTKHHTAHGGYTQTLYEVCRT